MLKNGDRIWIKKCLHKKHTIFKVGCQNQGPTCFNNPNNSRHIPKKKNCFDFPFGAADLLIDLVLITFTLTPQVSDLDERGAQSTDSQKLQGIQFTIGKALKITSAPRNVALTSFSKTCIKKVL